MLLRYQEIPAALGEMMGHPLSRSQLDWFQNLVGWSEDDTFDFKTFCGLCALCERLLAPEYYPQLPSKRLDPCHEVLDLFILGRIHLKSLLYNF